MRRTIAAVALAACVAVGVTASQAPTAHSTADWTVAPCVLWATTAQPVIPPYTYQDRCIQDDGQLSITPATLYPTNANLHTIHSQDQN